MSDAATRLNQALVASARAAGAAIEIREDDFTRWASATFDGGRHLVKLEGAQSAALDGWITSLPRLDLRLSGHTVCDLILRGVTHAGGRIRAHLGAITIANA